MTLKEKILKLLSEEDGLTDREITDKLFGKGMQQQSVNQTCRKLVNEGKLVRKVEMKGRIQNFIESTVNEETKTIHENDMVTKLKKIFIDSHIEIVFNKQILREVKLGFLEYDIENTFAGLRNNTLMDTIKKKKYSKFKATFRERYLEFSNMPIGDFLLMLKEKDDFYFLNYLNPNGNKKFCRFSLIESNLIDRRGIYFYQLSNEIAYIGRCRDSFRNRFNNGYGRISPKNCYIDGQSTNCKINSLVNQHSGAIKVFVLPMNDEYQIVSLEKELIQKYKPEWNVSLK